MTAENSIAMDQRASRPRVHKETENEDQAQDKTYELQLLYKKS